MAWVPKLILETFEELVDEDMKYFQWCLSSNVLEDFPHIPKSKLEGRDRLGTVDLLVETYGYVDAVTVTVKILMKMQQKLRADLLRKKYEEGKKL